MPLPPDSGSQPAVIRLFLLGEFRAERDGRAVPDGAWQRRGGKQLVKLLATVPDHRLHREQVLNLLWPELTPESAAGALRKALHHARHALEPTLPPRGESAYIRLHDDVVSLAGSSIRIDADEGQAMAETALETGDYEALVAALGAVGDELLPEDRYEDWTVARRSTLSDLHTRLLLRLADLEQETGRAGAAADRLRQIVARDPGREDVHRHLMRLAARHGHRHQALRQYQICCEALRREFDTLPEPETEALYQELLAGRDVPEPDGARLTDTARLFPAAAHRQATGMMVGRDPAFATVMEALRRAANGHGGALLIGGEAGIGKSRLAAEAARRAHDRGMLVLWGTADEQEGRLPYGVLVEALDRAVGSQAPNRREHLSTRFPELTGLLPALRSAGVGEAAGVAPHDTEGAGSSRTRIFAAIVALLDELRGRQPLMLVLDDLHAADAASLLIFSYLARMAGERPWLLVGTYRAGSVATRGDLKRLLTAVARDRLAARLAIERLEREETNRLVASLLPGGTMPTNLLDDLFARTLGNPLFVRELVRTMRDEGTLSFSGGRWIVAPGATAAVPRQVRDLIDTRVDRLGADVRQALTLAATAGMECSFRLLRDAGDFADAPLLDILDLALGANLLDERGDGYIFQHPLVRATLTEQLSRPRRARLHAALAAAIERQAEQAQSPRLAPIEALAHHWTEAGEPAQAIPYLMKAADRAARVHANTEAIDRLRQALRLLDDLGDASTVNRAAILERLGDLHALIGEAEPARSAFGSALEVGGLEALDRARLRRKCGRQALLAGALATAAAMLDEAEAALDEAADDQAATAERARILAVRAQSEFLSFRFPESLAAGEESLRLAEEADSPADVARACEMVAMACLPLGQWQRGMAFERRHESLSDLNAVVRDAADVHLCLSEYHLYGDQPAHAARDVLRALSEAERIGATRSLALCHYYLGNMAYFRGRFHEGLTRLDEAIARYRQIESASGEAIAIMMRGVTLTALGRLDEARQDMEHGVETAATGTLRSHALIRLYAGLGRNRLDANDAAGARDYAERALALAEEPSDCICYAAFLPVATAAFALTGDLPCAAELGERALRQARAIGTPPLLCMAQQANALVHALTGRWDAAFAALGDARRLAEDYGFPYELGRTLLMRSFVHMQRRRPRDLAAASALTAEASPILLRLGVRASAAQARTSLGFMRGHLRKRPDLATATD